MSDFAIATVRELAHKLGKEGYPNAREFGDEVIQEIERLSSENSAYKSAIQELGDAFNPGSGGLIAENDYLDNLGAATKRLIDLIDPASTRQSKTV